MNKLPKFLIAENVKATPNMVFVYHSRKPRFLALKTGSSFEIVDNIDNLPIPLALLDRLKEWYHFYLI